MKKKQLQDHFLAAEVLASLYIHCDGGSLFGSGGFGSVQPVNQQAIGRGAFGEDRPHL